MTKLLILLVVLFIILTKPNITYASVVVNEILPHPSSGDDWIELFNTESLEVDISGWSIEDSTSKIKTLPEGTKFTTASAYLQIFVSNRLNNGGDTIILKNKDGANIDEKSYDKDPGVDIAVGRFPDGNNTWGGLTSNTPNSTNSNYSPTATNEPEPTEKPTITSKSGSKEPVNTITNSTPTLKLQNTLTKTPTKTIGSKNYETSGAATPTQVVVGLVLGDVVNGSNSALAQPASKSNTPITIFVFLIVLGLGFLIIAAVVSFRKLRRSRA